MNQDNYPRSDWYAARPAAPRPAAGMAPIRRSHTGAKVAGIIVCVLLVLVASVYVFSDHFGFIKPIEGGFHIITPEERSAPPAAEEEPLPEDYAGDYRDFFSRYFAEANIQDEHAPSAIERAEPGTDFRIALQSAQGRQAGTLQGLYPVCLESIVSIRTLASGKPGYYMGSGIILSDDGLILTNQHLLAGTDTAYVTLPDDRELPALLVGEDASTDLAVLKVEAEGLRPAEFGDSGELTVGDDVFAIGSPMLPTLKGTLTSGIVSGIARSVSSGSRPMTLLQHTAPINEGSSGGALFNMYGQVVGITNMKLVNPYSDVQVEGMCFAIPSATAKAVTDQILATGSYVRPGIGITVGAIDAETAAHYGLPGGLYITAVSKGSDAEAKGVQPGDILVSINGIPVHSTDDVLSIRDTMRVGDTMTLSLYRDGEALEIEVELYDLSKLY